MAGRGRKRFVRRNKTGWRKTNSSGFHFGRLRERAGQWQHKERGACRKCLLLVAAGHCAIHRARLFLGRATMVLAFHRRLGGIRLRGGRLSRFLVPMSRAETVGATTHAIRLKSQRPQGCPEKQYGHQTHPRA